jgi:hypothetical protein
VLTWNPCAHGTIQCAQCAQMVHSVHSVHKRMQITSKVCKSLQYIKCKHLCAHFSPNILDTSQPLLEVSTVLEISWLHSHDQWAGKGAVGLVNWSMSRHVFLRPDPLNAIANYPLLPITAGHPDSQRAPKSGVCFLDSDTARWQKWIISKACLLGDGVPGTSHFLCSHGTHHVT